ncbi:MAG: alpha/beta hydrolase [Rhizobiaceae bacterium]|nr:alpha/beta hydrolase [Rhizobiaceae bacterium]
MRAAVPSPEMRTILERLAQEDGGLADPTMMPPSEGRAQASRSNQRWNDATPPMAQICDFLLTEGTSHPIACRILFPENPASGAILYLHGGGWAYCNMDTHDRAARLLAQEAGVPVVLCDYRLAPEHPFPAGLDDCIHVWRAMAGRHGPFAGLTGPLAISGDSAGANLALALMIAEQKAERDDGTLPDLGLLFYGVYGADFSTPSYVECADGPGLTRGKMMRYFDWYSPQASRQEPLVAPLRASDAMLRALPPLYLNAAEIDPLRSDSEQLYARLSSLGRADRFRIHSGVVHGFMQMSLELEEARQALSDAGAAFRSFVAQAAKKTETMEETK